MSKVPRPLTASILTKRPPYLNPATPRTFLCMFCCCTTFTNILNNGSSASLPLPNHTNTEGTTRKKIFKMLNNRYTISRTREWILMFQCFNTSTNYIYLSNAFTIELFHLLCINSKILYWSGLRQCKKILEMVNFTMRHFPMSQFGGPSPSLCGRTSVHHDWEEKETCPSYPRTS